jgi:hypothetical protein
MDQETLKRRIHLALELLGETSDEVAATLRLLGIRGIPCMAGHCPLARYLSQVAPDPDRMFTVGDDSVMSWLVGYFHVTVVPTTRAMKAFMIRFDAGGLPDLRESAA